MTTFLLHDTKHYITDVDGFPQDVLNYFWAMWGGNAVVDLRYGWDLVSGDLVQNRLTCPEILITTNEQVYDRIRELHQTYAYIRELMDLDHANWFHLFTRTQEEVREAVRNCDWANVYSLFDRLGQIKEYQLTPRRELMAKYLTWWRPAATQQKAVWIERFEDEYKAKFPIDDWEYYVDFRLLLEIEDAFLDNSNSARIMAYPVGSSPVNELPEVDDSAPPISIVLAYPPIRREMIQGQTPLEYGRIFGTKSDWTPGLISRFRRGVAAVHYPLWLGRYSLYQMIDPQIPKPAHFVLKPAFARQRRTVLKTLN